MSKLEQAIRKTADEGHFQSSVFNMQGSSCIEEIAKMETSYILDQKELKKKKIIYPGLENTELINSFRELRTSITDKYSQNIVMVTSVCEQAGTSFFARNLAAAIAFDASKTSLLMDCSLDKDGDVANTFSLQEKAGVSNYISDPELNVEDIIYESGIKRLRVMPFGSAEHGIDEYFSHPRFHNILGQTKHKYQDRNIIIDAPPISTSADARILLGLCDQVILIVPYGKVNQAKLDAAAKIVGREKLTGVVFNDYIK